MSTMITNRSLGSVRHRKNVVARQNERRREKREEAQSYRLWRLRELYTLIHSIGQEVPREAWEQVLDGAGTYEEAVSEIKRVPDIFTWGFPVDMYQWTLDNPDRAVKMGGSLTYSNRADWWDARNNLILQDTDNMAGSVSIYMHNNEFANDELIPLTAPKEELAVVEAALLAYYAPLWQAKLDESAKEKLKWLGKPTNTYKLKGRIVYEHGRGSRRCDYRWADTGKTLDEQSYTALWWKTGFQIIGTGLAAMAAGSYFFMWVMSLK